MSAEPRAAGSIAAKKRRRLRAALAASLLVHATAVGVLVRVARDQAPPRPPAPRSPIEFSLQETSRPLAAPLPAPAAPLSRRPRPAGPAAGPLARAPAPVAPSPPQSAPGPAAPGATPRINLSFEALAGDAQRRAVASADEPALEGLLRPPPSGGRRSVDELRAESERQSAAESNVRQGRAPPVLYDYLRDARVHLEGQATRLAESLPLGPGQTMKGWARGYLGRVAEVNRRAASDLPQPPDDDFGHRPDVLGGYREAEHQAASGAEARTAEVCLGIAPGHAVVVTLRRSSGHAALDQLALQSFEAARDKRPLDDDVRPGLACYTVRISAYRVPPLPSLGLGIKNGKPDLIYPLKRITQITVELRSLDHGDRPASSSLLRAP